MCSHNESLHRLESPQQLKASYISILISTAGANLQENAPCVGQSSQPEHPARMLLVDLILIENPVPFTPQPEEIQRFLMFS